MTTPVDRMEGGVLRVTLPMPSRPGHVHAYLLPGDDGWTIVDTGLGLPDARERWASVLDEVDGPIARIFVTHFHPDHVGAARDVAELTGASVHQGALDYEQCERTWQSSDRQDITWAWLRANGVPPGQEKEMRAFGQTYQHMTRYEPDPILHEPGDSLDGWQLVAAPGHADGQLVLLKDGILVAGDHLLAHISPAIGLWPDSSPDPLGDYLEALSELPTWSARVAFPGHGEVIEAPAARAAELVAHHRDRLGHLASELTNEPRTSYGMSYRLFGRYLSPAGRRFAVTETASHLERLVREGGASRHEIDDGLIAYSGA